MYACRYDNSKTCTDHCLIETKKWEKGTKNNIERSEKVYGACHIFQWHCGSRWACMKIPLSLGMYLGPFPLMRTADSLTALDTAIYCLLFATGDTRNFHFTFSHTERSIPVFIVKIYSRTIELSYSTRESRGLQSDEPRKMMNESQPFRDLKLGIRGKGSWNWGNGSACLE